MKNKFVYVIALCALLLPSCGKVDEVAQKVMDDINSIGEVEVADKELIEKIENTYLTLTDKQKDQIDNYAVLLNARDELNELTKKQAEEERKKKEQEEEERKKLYTKEVKFCAKAIVSLKEALKDPDSMKINEFSYEKLSNKEYCFLDISGTNGFGGTTREIYIVTDDSSLSTSAVWNSKTFLYTCPTYDVYDSEFVSIGAQIDKVDHEVVYQLLEEYEETGDMDLLKS